MRRIGIFLLRSVRRGSVPDIRYRSKVICSHWPNDVEELFLRYFSLAVDRILCTQQVKVCMDISKNWVPRRYGLSRTVGTIGFFGKQRSDTSWTSVQRVRKIKPLCSEAREMDSLQSAPKIISH